jgi:predicted transcriptional regulator of viral defense system
MGIDNTELIKNSPLPVYTRQNLQLLLGNNRRTLDYRIYSLIKNKILRPIKRGVYLNEYFYLKSTDPEGLLRYVGCILVPNSYVSLQYALACYGLIPEAVYAMTFVTTNKPRKYIFSVPSFIYRNIKKDLFWGYNTISIGNLTYQMATPAKALFDSLYLAPVNSFFDMRLNLDNLSDQDKVEFTQAVEKSKSVKMQKILKYDFK